MSGPAGRIEGKYHPQQHAQAPLAILMHPHPSGGGTMNHKIVHALYRCFFAQGFSVLRFNFRGVGKSEGSFDQGEGELADAAAALDWMQSVNPQVSSCWIGGFSFGALICMQLLMRRPEMAGFVAISPPANLYDFNFLAPCPTSGLIIQGDADPIVDKNAVDRLAHKLNQQKNIHIDYRVVEEADHFFTKHMDVLSHHVSDYLISRLGNPHKVAAHG